MFTIAGAEFAKNSFIDYRQKAVNSHYNNRAAYMACNLSTLISESVASLESDTDIQTAAAYMAECGLGSLVVTENGEVIGLFTERDLLTRVVGAGKDADALNLGEVCTRNLISVSSDSSCAYAIKLMRRNRCRRLLVYRNDNLQGLVNMSEVAHALADHNSSKNILVNLVGGITLVVVLAVIGMLISHIPDMIQLADHTLK
ncbi:MAG: CBS domain-containing protein [Candidatus Thiodiazotropha sp. (ex Lucina aurantia)]|nr:CBS domain-containing protein [Candidatus Thiodiazotropha sp. (ex Lucina pensylvanica)]MBT3023272.1 CBS domain-containing protein [Candidatus Thiodiazotropha taylori]MBV2100666.1 CBS domain-containing protein [Candidatus Thiodiazotropha sp. (ex Codakia orbicularis)]MBV2103049.1 CBS domain-containing protein [Candidatus Thiodiazotropha sp. (ex Lucina aurantia)]MBV2117784.1 CBS domain-containing protein [Candidatus Thiodiazotropha sp. (ex Lucina aurantia)]